MSPLFFLSGCALIAVALTILCVACSMLSSKIDNELGNE